MKTYDSDDMIVIYFIIVLRDSGPMVRAWTDDKDLAKAYLEFHKCKDFKIKERSGIMSEMVQILNENINDEIALYNLTVANPNPKKGRDSMRISVPMTSSEHILVSDEILNYMASRIDYSFAFQMYGFLKDKYKHALKKIFFEDIMYNVLHGRKSKILEELEINDLLVFLLSTPDEFGI